MKRSLLLVVAVACLALAPGGNAADRTASASAVAADLPADTVGMDWSKVPEYRMVPGDLLALNFGPRPDGLSDNIRQTRVRPDGRISVFPVGDVVAAGRTPAELEQALVQLLAPSLKLPRVTVEVVEVSANVVHVMGQVVHPQSVVVRPFMTALQAVAEAGGFRDDAARNSVVVFHRDGARTVRVARLRLDHAVKSGSPAADVPVGRFDIVYVPRSTVSNLDLFTRQFLTGPNLGLDAVVKGWELFNLDRVFILPSR